MVGGLLAMQAPVLDQPAGQLHLGIMQMRNMTRDARCPKE